MIIKSGTLQPKPKRDLGFESTRKKARSREWTISSTFFGINKSHAKLNNQIEFKNMCMCRARSRRRWLYAAYSHRRRHSARLLWALIIHHHDKSRTRERQHTYILYCTLKKKEKKTESGPNLRALKENISNLWEKGVVVIFILRCARRFTHSIPVSLSIISESLA